MISPDYCAMSIHKTVWGILDSASPMNHPSEIIKEVTSQFSNMGVDDRDEILTALGVDDEELLETPESRFERRLLSAMVEARRDGIGYWRLFELLDGYQQAAIHASFERGEFGTDHAEVDESTVQYSQVVHATARALNDGAGKRGVLFNLASAYQLFEDDWSEE